MVIGAQFYTLREHCKDLDSFALSLRKVADIGYTTVQISGTCQYDPQWLKEQLDKNGLKCPLTHAPVQQLVEQTQKVCDDHKIFGCKYIGLGFYNFKKVDPAEAYPAFLEQYKPVAKTIRENGLYFMYHNHDAEFKKLDGQVLLERIAQDFSPEELGIILDTYWIQKGGANPAEYIRKLSGRVPCIHLKDYAYDAVMAVVGEGNINFDAVISAAEDAGTQYLLVEQDNCNGEDPFDCLKRSYENLKAIGLE